jgi:hypothetical protein
MIALLGFTLPSYAVGKKAGTSGAQFLKIGAGARPTAMGDAFVGIADDVNAVYYNPAGLGFMDRPEFTAMHTQYFQGLDYDYGAFAQPLKMGTLAISAATLKTDAITRRGADESALGTFENQDAAYALSYGRKFGDTLAGGVTARWVRESIDSTSAQTWSTDWGIHKRFEGRPFTLGLAVRHLGKKITFNEEGDPLPLTIDGGAGMDLLQNRLKLGLDVRHVRDTGLKYGLGAEWHQSLRDKYRYAVRAGYNSANTDAGGATGISLGAGVGFRALDLDFAWIPFGNLGNTFRYAAHLKF